MKKILKNTLMAICLITSSSVYNIIGCNRPTFGILEIDDAEAGITAVTSDHTVPLVSAHNLTSGQHDYFLAPAEIPGSAYRVITHNNFAIVPAGKAYRIVVQATGIGQFDLDIDAYERFQVKSRTTYQSIPVTSVETEAEVTITPSNLNPILRVDTNVDTNSDEVIDASYTRTTVEHFEVNPPPPPSGPSISASPSIVANGDYVFRYLVSDGFMHIAQSSPVIVTGGSPPGPSPVPPPSPTGQSVVSFTLINADTDQPISGFDPISSGATLDYSTLPTRNLNIRANTSPATVGSVVFNLNGVESTESRAPYALAGDLNGDYYEWTPATGNYTLTATPFDGAGGSGNAGTSLTLDFTVTDGGEGPPPPLAPGTVTVSGELKKWHPITLTLDSLNSSEAASNNPFLNYRLDVTFSRNGRSITVPGYFAADGNAGESGAIAGTCWRAHFVPDEEGTWNYSIAFKSGTNVAINGGGETAGSGDGMTGSFIVGATDKTGRDHRGKGILEYTGERYLKFAGTGEYFLKGGANSPENFLAYADFDQTTPTHSYAPHAGDWQTGDPTWQGGKGKEIIGALNYLASKGMNSVYFLTMNVAGDGNDVWPWTSSGERFRFDVSKLDQWEKVFSHMDRKGIMLHVVTQETENDQLLDGGTLGIERKLYYRELIARFGHHLALVWNLGEENTNTPQERKDFANYIRGLDPYDHPIVIHNWPDDREPFNSVLGFDAVEGPSVQVGDMASTHNETLYWISQSAASGRQWFVSLDEIGPADVGVVPDADDPNHDSVRKQALWGNLMAGGAGVEWYFGYSYPDNDLNAEDWRSRDTMWNQTRYALDFFQQHLPFTQMGASDGLTSATNDYVLAKPGQVYAVYLPNGGTTNIDLGSTSAQYTVRWYDPRSGGALQSGSVATLMGPGIKSIGNPPSQSTSDWVVLVQNTASPLPSQTSPSPSPTPPQFNFRYGQLSP